MRVGPRPHRSAGVASAQQRFRRSRRRSCRTSCGASPSAAPGGSAPCCPGWCASETAEQTVLKKLPVPAAHRVRLWALGSYSCLHYTAETNKVVLVLRSLNQAAEDLSQKNKAL